MVKKWPTIRKPNKLYGFQIVTKWPTIGKPEKSSSFQMVKTEWPRKNLKTRQIIRFSNGKNKMADHWKTGQIVWFSNGSSLDYFLKRIFFL